MISSHAVERIRIRIAQAGLDLISILNLAEQFAQKTTKDTAILLCTIQVHIGSTDADYYARQESNGNQVWAIVRDQQVVTFMFRREDPPTTPQALRVDEVVKLTPLA